LRQLKQSMQKFEIVVQRIPDDHLAYRSRNRIGTICQITGRHQESLTSFRVTAGQTNCSECRIEAYLGLIESYEFLEEPEKAINMAESISDQDLPIEEKQKLSGDYVTSWNTYRLFSASVSPGFLCSC